MSHYHRGYYCKNLNACIAVDQFHKETFSPGKEKLKERTHIIYRRPEKGNDMVLVRTFKVLEQR